MTVIVPSLLFVFKFLCIAKVDKIEVAMYDRLNYYANEDLHAQIILTT